MEETDTAPADQHTPQLNPIEALGLSTAATSSSSSKRRRRSASTNGGGGDDEEHAEGGGGAGGTGRAPPKKVTLPQLVDARLLSPNATIELFYKGDVKGRVTVQPDGHVVDEDGTNFKTLGNWAQAKKHVPYTAVPFSVFRVAGTTTTLMDLKLKFFEKGDAGGSAANDKLNTTNDELLKDGSGKDSDLNSTVVSPTNPNQSSTLSSSQQSHPFASSPHQQQQQQHLSLHNSSSSNPMDLTQDTLSEVKDLHSRITRIEEKMSEVFDLLSKHLTGASSSLGLGTSSIGSLLLGQLASNNNSTPLSSAPAPVTMAGSSTPTGTPTGEKTPHTLHDITGLTLLANTTTGSLASKTAAAATATAATPTATAVPPPKP